jgi:hypothetical protein
MQMGSIGVQAYLTNKVGPAVADASLRVAALNFAANIAGMAGGIINTFSMLHKHADANTQGDYAASDLYLISLVMFSGTAGSSAALAIGGLAETALARGSTSAIVRTIAIRAGTTAGTSALVNVGGIALTVSGVGLVLLGLGVVVQIGAVALTPSDVQRWVSRSYFGLDKEIMGIWGGGKRNDRFKNWETELAELNAIMLKPAPPPAKEEKIENNLPACLK